VTGVIAWYIRHGHNLANQHPRRLSHKVVDYPLTGLGVAQATALGGRLARERAPAAVYASPLRRAVQTAEIIARACGGAVVIVEELRELDVGDLDGRSDQHAWAIHDRVLADWQAGRHDSAFPGGENYHQAATRLATALQSALRHPDGGCVLFIGHGAILRATIPAICPGTPRPATDLHNCDMAELELRPALHSGVTGILNQWPVRLGDDPS
jgi:broad specificity phosphatase PhoE